MNLRAQGLARIDLTVADLERAERFYVGALGFEPCSAGGVDPALASLLGASRIDQVVLRRGEQEIALQTFDPAGRAYPEGRTAADLIFQHFALVTHDIGAAYDRLAPVGPRPISMGGPQKLPQRSGGATAFKFRDPDGHPLELLQFADGRAGGIDHSAIAVADVDRSIAFYQDALGVRLAARQRNSGVAQDALDGLAQVQVDVVSLTPAAPMPHIELLGYRSPRGRPHAALRPADIAATRLVLHVAEAPEGGVRLGDGSLAAILTDPDGHIILAVQR